MCKQYCLKYCDIREPSPVAVTGESMVILAANADKLRFAKELVDYVRQRVPEITSIVHNINRKKTNVILGERNVVLCGRDHIVDRIGEFAFKISPLSFFQVNPIQTEVLNKNMQDLQEMRQYSTYTAA